MNFKQKYHFKNVSGVFTVEGWLESGSFDMGLKITRDEKTISSNPRKCVVLGDLIELSNKLLLVLEKHKELNP